MAKGAISKEHITQTAVAIFNVHGYVGTSLKLIMEKTGFTKGGIYRHFSCKEELAAAAFKLAYQQMKAAYAGTYLPADAADIKLIKFLERMKTFMLKPPVKGGCPILNSSVEVDDTNEPLRKVVVEAANDWENIMTHIFKEGVKTGVFKPSVQPRDEARFFIASIEGAIMLCKLHRSTAYGLMAADTLTQRIALLKP
jgi:TetR/AcrR family transcriptional regulator, transcriptional repressor for nem operon